MGDRVTNGLTALGAAAAAGLPGLVERKKADELSHLLKVVAAIVLADYLASVRAAAHPGVGAEVAYDIITQRPDGVPLQVDGMSCDLAVAVAVTDDLPLRGLHVLHGTITGPYAALKAIVDILALRAPEWMDGTPEFKPDGKQATVLLRIAVSNPNEPNPNIPFVAGKLA